MEKPPIQNPISTGTCSSYWGEVIWGHECEKTNHIAQLLFNIKETMRAECFINSPDVEKTLFKGSHWFIDWTSDNAKLCLQIAGEVLKELWTPLSITVMIQGSDLMYTLNVENLLEVKPLTTFENSERRPHERIKHDNAFGNRAHCTQNGSCCGSWTSGPMREGRKEKTELTVHQITHTRDAGRNDCVEVFSRKPGI